MDIHADDNTAPEVRRSTMNVVNRIASLYGIRTLILVVGLRESYVEISLKRNRMYSMILEIIEWQQK